MRTEQARPVRLQDYRPSDWLIYKVDLSDDKDVLIDMTLTAPGCPVAGEMPGWIEDAVMTVPGIKSARANLVFDPPWDPSKMSDEAKLALNMF